MLVTYSSNIVLRGRGFCSSPIAQITRSVPILLAAIVEIFMKDFLGIAFYKNMIDYDKGKGNGGTPINGM